jgi:hypothetical protein
MEKLPESELFILDYYNQHIKPAVEGRNTAHYHACCNSISKRKKRGPQVVHQDTRSLAYLFKKRDNDTQKIKDLIDFLKTIDSQEWFLPYINLKKCSKINPRNEEVEDKEDYAGHFDDDIAQEDFNTVPNKEIEKAESITKHSSDQLQVVALENVFQYIGKRNNIENEEESFSSPKNFNEPVERPSLTTILQWRLDAAEKDK